MSTKPVRVLLVGKDPAIDDIVKELNRLDDLYLLRRPTLELEEWPDIVFGVDGAIEHAGPVHVDVREWAPATFRDRVVRCIADVRPDVEARPARRPALPSFKVVMRSGRSEVVSFQTGELVYAEVRNKGTTLYLNGSEQGEEGRDTLWLRRPLRALKPWLSPEQFAQISRSIIVNTEYVRIIRRVDHELDLRGGGTLGIQRFDELERLGCC